jgi:hypothetical protein
MKPPFAVVVVHGDGSRVLRFSLPRWLAYGALGIEAAVLAATVGFSGDYAVRRREVDALRARADDQRARLDSFERGLPAIRSEIKGWKAAHARMWRAFGLEAGAKETENVAAGASGELDVLASGIAEEKPRLHELERVVSRTSKLVNALPLRWPIHGPVNSEYGLRRSPWTGKPAAGTVVAATSHGRLGKHVAVDHGHGVTSLYGHLQAFDVKAGQRVEKGEVLGLVGNTGRSTGPHLHYELMVAGRPVDPRGFLEGVGGDSER